MSIDAAAAAHLLAALAALMVAAHALGTLFAGFFGAFAAGIAVGAAGEAAPAAIASIEGFSFAFFIPIYFAIVGLQLDLLHGFSVAFFLLFLLLACAIKAGSVYLGARLAGETSGSSVNLAVALNARGGPGIVVASVAYAAGIIGQPFYAALVMLAIVTSLLAGSWLAHIPKERLLTGHPASRQPSPAS